MNLATDVHANIVDLLARANINAKLEDVTPCTLGGNNRIYRAATSVGVFAAKQYFRHADDTRDRLAAEYAFLTYAVVAAPGITPRPYAYNAQTGMALYEFVEGQPLRAGEIGAAEVDAAIQFFRALNAPPSRTAIQLPDAAEACFTIADHLALIDKRIKRLLVLIPHSDIDMEVVALSQKLNEFWQQLSQNIHVDARRANIDCNARQLPEQRCISPSDFGFHNALAISDGSIRFLDFEYAGRDDTAKMTGDFFAQLAVPVPIEHYDNFLHQCMNVLPEPALGVQRAKLLRSAYQVKWCCIALNVFTPVHLARRKFANPDLDETALKQTQFVKAKQLFQSIQTNTHGLR